MAVRGAALYIYIEAYMRACFFFFFWDEKRDLFSWAPCRHNDRIYDYMDVLRACTQPGACLRSAASQHANNMHPASRVVCCEAFVKLIFFFHLLLHYKIYMFCVVAQDSYMKMWNIQEKKCMRARKHFSSGLLQCRTSEYISVNSIFTSYELAPQAFINV